MLYEAGAKEIHMRISSPPIKFPDYYGIDFGDPNELIANKLSVDEIREKIGVDSLHYLSIEGLVRATGLPREEFNLAYFNGEYPIEPPKGARLGKYIFEEAAVKQPE